MSECLSILPTGRFSWISATNKKITFHQMYNSWRHFFWQKAIVLILGEKNTKTNKKRLIQFKSLICLCRFSFIQVIVVVSMWMQLNFSWSWRCLVSHPGGFFKIEQKRLNRFKQQQIFELHSLSPLACLDVLNTIIDTHPVQVIWFLTGFLNPPGMDFA